MFDASSVNQLISWFYFQVAIHESYNFHDDNSDIKYISNGTEVFISVQPESTYSTSNILHLPSDERDCAFDNEIQLATMQKYTYTNCMAECRSKLYLKLCECVPHNLPNNGYTFRKLKKSININLLNACRYISRVQL